MKRKMILLIMLLLLGFGYSNAQYGPVVSFTYDDGFASWYDIGFPVFQEYGFPGVVYINATNWWIQDSGTLDKLLEMQAAGWEISSHTYDHNGIEESNVSAMKDWLDANGFPNSGFGAPNNIWDHRRVNIIKRYHPYYAGSIIKDGGLSQPFDIYFIQRFILTNAVTIEAIRGYLDDAVANNKWIIFSAHDFGGTYGDGSTWYQSEELLRMVFDEIVARGIPVKTVREVITDLYPPGCVIECSEDTLQDPVLTYFEEGGGSFSTSVWNEYWHNTSWTGPRYLGSPVVYCHTSNKSLPVMKFYRNVSNGEYEVRASIIAYDTDRTYRLYYSFDEGNPSQYNVEVNKNSDVSLGTVTVTDGQFALYTQKADAVSGGDGYVGWAFIKLLNDDPVPVELTSFSAQVNEGEVTLNWETETEVDNYGFEVQRSVFGVQSSEWIKIGFIEGHGNSNSPKEYSYTDKDLFAGGSKFQYRLKQVDNDGSFEYSDVVEVEIVPNKYELSQNFPNPFNPSTTIRFSLPKQTQLKLNLYNMLGELVETIAEGNYEVGNYKVNFNASNLPSGVYIYRIESSDFVQTRKMVLIK